MTDTGLPTGLLPFLGGAMTLAGAILVFVNARLQEATTPEARSRVVMWTILSLTAAFNLAAVVALTAWALEVRVPARSTARAVIPTNENGIPIFGATPGKVEVTSMPASPSPQVVTLLDNVTVTADAPATFGPVVVDGFREIVF